MEAPNYWPKVEGWRGEPELRSRQVKTFRYRIVYQVSAGEVRIIAYAHLSRQPGY